MSGVQLVGLCEVTVVAKERNSFDIALIIYILEIKTLKIINPY